MVPPPARLLVGDRRTRCSSMFLDRTANDSAAAESCGTQSHRCADSGSSFTAAVPRDSAELESGHAGNCCPAKLATLLGGDAGCGSLTHRACHSRTQSFLYI